MSQSDIYDLLKRKRLSGDESYLTASEIRKQLLYEGKSICESSIYPNIKKLRRYGFLEYNIEKTKKKNLGNVNFVYRLKKEFI
jgi:DNA-binding PadR family transcriptional regulator